MKLFLCFSMVCVFTWFGCQSSGDSEHMSQEELLQKGEYLVTISGCNDVIHLKK
jgi:hypothetical protein